MEITRADAETHLARVAALLAAYDRIETAYVSRGRAERRTHEGDYDHLARRGEWEGAEE